MSALNSTGVQKQLQHLQLGEKKSCQSKPALESFLDILKEGAFSDVTFIVGPTKERIPCHQLFLKTRSSVFEVMFSERWNQGEEVPLEDVDPKIFKKFLQYIYADTFEVNVPEALELLQIAHKYDVQLLVGKCEKLLESEVTLDAAVDVFQVAREYEMIQLKDITGDLMAKSLFKLKTLPSFSRLDKETLMYILKRNDLTMKEVNLFRLAVSWGKGQSGSTLQQNLEDVLPLIRFPIMTLNEFTTTVVPTGLLSQATLVQLFTYFGNDIEARKSLANTLQFSTEQRQWQSVDSSAFVALYSWDFANCRIRRQEYMQLSEYLKFAVDVIYDVDSPISSSAPKSFEAESSENIKDKKVGLSGITFYCPILTNDIKCGFTPTVTKEFKILVEAKTGVDGDWQEIRTLSFIKCEEGKMTEAEFDPAIPLEGEMHFGIEVVETMFGQGVIESQNYEAIDFGEISQLVTKEFEGKCVEIGKFRKFQFGTVVAGKDLLTKPQLIYKLSIKEL